MANPGTYRPWRGGNWPAPPACGRAVGGSATCGAAVTSCLAEMGAAQREKWSRAGTRPWAAVRTGPSTRWHESFDSIRGITPWQAAAMVIVRRGFVMPVLVQLELQDAQSAPAGSVDGDCTVAGEAGMPAAFLQIGADAVGSKSARGCNKISAKQRQTVPDAQVCIFSGIVCPNQTASCGSLSKTVPFLDLQRVVPEQDNQSFPLWRSVFRIIVSRMHIRRKASPLPGRFQNKRRNPAIVRSFVRTAALGKAVTFVN